MGYNYPHFESPFIQGLYNWQTALGAGIALLGDWLLWRQVQAAGRHEAECQRRRFAAARATLPHILSELATYLESAMEWMCVVHSDARQSKPLTDPPPFPITITAALKRMIEATSVDQAAAACIRFFGSYRPSERVFRASRVPAERQTTFALACVWSWKAI